MTSQNSFKMNDFDCISRKYFFRIEKKTFGSSDFKNAKAQKHKNRGPFKQSARVSLPGLTACGGDARTTCA